MAKKSNTAAKVAIGIIALGLVAGALGAATRGFRNWDPETWFNYWGQGEPEGSDPDTTEPGDQVIEGEKLNVLLKGGPRFAAKSSVGDTKSVIATLLNSQGNPATSQDQNGDPSDLRIAWESSDPSKVSLGSEVTKSGEANTLKLESLFAGEVTITVKPMIGLPGMETTFTVDYQSAVQSLEIVGWYTPDEIENPMAKRQYSASAYNQYATDVHGQWQLSRNHAMNWAEQGDYSSIVDCEESAGQISNQDMVDALENPLHFYKLTERDGVAGATLFTYDIAYVLVKGKAAEGAEDIDLGEEGLSPTVTIDGEPYQYPFDNLGTTQGEDATEIYGFFPIEGIKARDDLFVDYEYSLGDASIQFRLWRYFAATGVQASESSVTF